MAGHSKFKNIMHRKGAQDQKRAKIFARASREIEIAVKIGGADQSANSRLRNAIANARSLNMPKDNISRAIDKGSKVGGDGYEEIRYEAYGPHGVALIVDVLTDNKNRSASVVRSTIAKNGGTLGATGSATFMFNRVGSIVYDVKNNAEDIVSMAIDLGCDDVEESEEFIHVITKDNEFYNILEKLTEILGDPVSANIEWQPASYIDLTEEQMIGIEKLVNALDDDDDVQNVYTNASGL